MRSGDVVGALVVRRKEPGESRRPVVQKSRESQFVAARMSADSETLGIPIIELVIGPCGHESSRITSDGLACEGPVPALYQELAGADQRDVLGAPR